MTMAFHQRRDALYAKHGEKLLTILTALLALLMFVGAPLVAMGGATFHLMGGLVILAMIVVAILLYGNLFVLIPLTVAFAMNVTAVVFRHMAPSDIDIYLSSTAWLILSATLAWIVARNVFAPGRVTYHRIVGAVFLYLLVAMAFASLYMIIGANNPAAFNGLRRDRHVRQRGASDLFQHGDADDGRVRRHRARLRVCARSLKPRVGVRRALSRHAHRPARQPGNRRPQGLRFTPPR